MHSMTKAILTSALNLSFVTSLSAQEPTATTSVAGGYSIDYTGGLNATGAMVLTGNINYYSTGKSPAFRGKWSVNTDGSVRQFFEQQNAGTGEWVVWFDGHYVRR